MPPDPTIDPDALGSRAPHLSPALVGVVALGGAVGTGARYLAVVLIPRVGGWPWPTYAVNLVGAFVLGWLLEALVRRGPDHGHRRVVRLLVGTGFCGGFTTYSSFAVDIDTLLRGGSVAIALAYAVSTVVVGFLLSALGIWVGARTTRARAA